MLYDKISSNCSNIPVLSSNCILPISNVVPVLIVVLKPHWKPNLCSNFCGQMVANWKKVLTFSYFFLFSFFSSPSLSFLSLLFSFSFSFFFFFYSPPPWFFLTARILHKINTIFNLILSLVDISSKISTPTASHTHYTK